MIEINLLPKELQKKKFRLTLDKNIVITLLSGVAIILLLGAFSFILQSKQLNDLQKQYDQYKAENERLAQEIVKIDEITKNKEQILARMSAIELLDRNREYWVRLLEDVAQRVPEYVWLTNVKQAPLPVAPPATAAPASPAPATPPAPAIRSSIEGYSFSLNALATFMVRLKKSDIVQDLEISSIKLQEADKIKAYAFKFTCNFAKSLGETVVSETAQSASVQSNQF